MITIFHSGNSLEKILVVVVALQEVFTGGALNTIDGSSSAVRQYPQNIAMKINLQPKWKKKYIVALYLHLFAYFTGMGFSSKSLRQCVSV